MMRHNIQPLDTDAVKHWRVLPTDTEQSQIVLGDLSLFLSLSESAQRAFEEFYRSLPRPTNFPEPETRRTLSVTSSVPLDDTESILRLFRFLLRAISSGEYSITDVQADLDTLNIEPEDRERMITLLTRLTQSRPELPRLYHEDRTSTITLPTVETLSVSENIRAVYDNKEALISSVPVAIIRLVLKTLHDHKEMVFQANQEELDEVCDILGKHRRALAEFAKNMTLHITDNEESAQ